MKKVIAVLVIFACVGATLSAQDWFNSYADGIDESSIFVNAGIGYGFMSAGYKMGIPPISVSADYKLPISLPITVGLTGAFATSKIDGYDTDEMKMSIVDIGFGVRAHYHFNFVPNLDTYAGITLGYVIEKVKFSGSYFDALDDASKEILENAWGVSYFLYGANIGARYFFTNNIGAYLELGYSGLQVASVGLALKF